MAAGSVFFAAACGSQSGPALQGATVIVNCPSCPDGEPTPDLDPDEDGDGSPASEDCDDQDATVYPGAPEICDGQDNDCDGRITDEVCPDDDDETPTETSGHIVAVTVTIGQTVAKVTLNAGYCSDLDDPFACDDWQTIATGENVGTISGSEDVGVGVYRFNTAEDTDGDGIYDHWLAQLNGSGGCEVTATYKVTLDGIDVTSMAEADVFHTGGCSVGLDLTAALMSID